MVAKSCDHDFLFIDMQHGGISVEAAVDITLTALGAGIAPIVRVPDCDNRDVPRLIGSGAMGIAMPAINTVDEAHRAVASCKFPPVGRQSVADDYPHFALQRNPLANAPALMNDNILLVCMIETREGLKNIEEIATVDGVDVLYISANNILNELGLSGQFEHEILRDVRERLIKVCRANGKFAGFGGDNDAARQADFIRRGGSFVTTHSDLGYLVLGAEEHARVLRAAQLIGGREDNNQIWSW